MKCVICGNIKGRGNLGFCFRCAGDVDEFGCSLAADWYAVTYVLKSNVGKRDKLL